MNTTATAVESESSANWKNAAASCACCGNTGWEVLHNNVWSIYAETSYRLLRCQQCHHVQTSPPPPAEVLSQVYQATYQYDVHLAVKPEKRYRCRRLARSLAGEMRLRDCRVLEVGCMHGFLLRALQDRGAEVEGIEIDADAVQLCKQAGLHVRKLAVEELNPSDNTGYDLIVMMHVLEHVADPAQTVRKLAGLLKPGGQITICVPNSRSLTARILGRAWGWWQVPIHLNHFHAGSLKELLQRNGLTITRSRHRGGDSLLLMLNILNLLGRRGDKKKRPLGRSGRLFLNIYCRIFKYWCWFGDEELVVSARRHA